MKDLSELLMIPLISIVVPSYNYAHFLGRAIQSVIDQKYPHWELLIIDNNSTDNTREVINSFGNEKIRVFSINNGGIIATSRNKGIREAKGEWICFLDADDWWTNDKLSVCINYMNDADIIYHDLYIAGKPSNFFETKITKSRKLHIPILADMLINGNAINNSSVMVRARLLKEVGLINESKEMIATEDYNTWLKIACFTDRFLYIPKCLGFYYIHHLGASQKNMSISTKAAISEFLHRLNQKEKSQAEATLKYISGRYFYQEKIYKHAIPDLKDAFLNGTPNTKIKSLYLLFISFIALIVRKNQ